MFPDLEHNLLTLLEAIDDCLAKDRILPCLMLLYAGIDGIAALEDGQATRSIFMKWVDAYLLKNSHLPCTASDLYGARCGILHTHTMESTLWKEGRARQLLYAWGNANTDDLDRVIKILHRSECVVHLGDLITAFRNGIAEYLQDVMRDAQREEKLKARANRWLTTLSQEYVRDVLKAQSAPRASGPPGDRPDE
jgi:hypothetical protein